ncbi:DoxX family protein [Streptomyces sp. IBSNAI002]|uniref:DoxX family protein n=1 Tax=Streptomyces sp. IBSNAI002 TaxID=3457500 RepID=UPI003FD6691D
MAVNEQTERPGPEPLASSRASRVLMAVCRVTVALLWIQNLSWKHPPDFGHSSDPPEDLYAWTLRGVDNEVFAPWAWLVEHVIVPHFAVFAWGAFAIEACLGAFLLVGLAARFWALVGLVQTTAITFSVLNTPHEWFWSYFLMYAVHLALLATAAGRAYGVDGALRPLWRQRGGRLSRVLIAAS